MNTNLVINELNRRQNGSFFNMTWTSDIPLTAAAKRDGVVVYKTSTTTVRKGIDYSAQKSVQMKVEHGKELTHELPWGKWKSGYEGLIIEHTNKAGVYKEYVRLYLTPNRPKVQYFYNGNPISKENLMNLGVVLKSYWAKKEEKPDALTVAIGNIQSIG